MNWKIYLAGEIHTDWRDDLKRSAEKLNLPVEFFAPVTDHAASDDCGVSILGPEENAFWHDRKGASLNAIRTRTLIEKSDIVVVKFGEKYRQWNAAFDAGLASAQGKSLIVVHPSELQHALKEIDAAANAVTDDVAHVADLLRYIIDGKLG